MAGRCTNRILMDRRFHPASLIVVGGGAGQASNFGLIVVATVLGVM
jgi:hypothetical protein